MKYFLDVEFNELGGDLISLALVCENGTELYISTDCPAPKSWVKENVIPIIDCAGARSTKIDRQQFGPVIANFMADDPYPSIVTDWPDDIKYFCQAIVVGPGQMVNIIGLQFKIIRVDAYPTKLPDAIQHNALWDARALQYKLREC